MSKIIKFREASTSTGVRPLTSSLSPKSGVKDRTDPELAAARRELEAMQTRLDEKDTEIERLVEAMAAAFKDGQADGRTTALEEAAADRDALTSKLEGAIEQAFEILERDLSSLERLAVELAVESLNKIFGQPGAFAELAPQLIRHQLSQLDKHSIVRMQVSTADFPNSDELATLGAAISQRQVDILADPELDSGSCRITLTLGTLEIGIGQQWGRLKGVLETLAEPVADET